MAAPATTDDSTAPLSAEQLAHFEKRLLEERKRALRELGRLGENFGTSMTAADGDITSYPLHQADQGTDTMEQEKNYLLASQEGRLVWDIDDALRRLYRTPEAFGKCQRCGRAVSFERLDAIPHAALCITCEQRSASGTGDG